MTEQRHSEQSNTLDEARWAVGWLVGLIEDGRVDDLHPDDDYVQRARDVLGNLDAEADSRS